MAATPLTVMTQAGPVRGRQAGSCMEFLGIPYADPPAPAHRFDPPRPPSRWRDAHDATRFGATAARPPMRDGLIPEPPVPGANCLNLNVWTPAPGRTGLPVLVWIPGGAFVTGGNSSPWYHGGRFGADEVVLVAINYRLGAEGFLMTEDGPANRGILDMVQALRWVQQNIAAFGGDPGRVTIAGQSAGAMACLALLACPAASGTFRRVAAISPAEPVIAAAEQARMVAKSFCEQLGVPARAAELNRSDLARRLRVEERYLPPGMSFDPPRSADQRAASAGVDGLSWRPCLDGETVTTVVPDAIRRSDSEGFLIGTTTDELNFDLWPAYPPATREACEKGFANLGIGSGGIARYLAASRSGTWAEALAQARTDRRFRLPARQLADVSAAAGRDTYVYQFGWRSPGSLGAAHCLDVPFFFGNLDAPGTVEVLGREPPAALATIMHGALVNFARKGNPGWPAYRLPDRATMIFDRREHVTLDPFPSPRFRDQQTPVPLPADR
jgi:para-nitrobenzyl esterase